MNSQKRHEIVRGGLWSGLEQRKIDQGWSPTLADTEEYGIDCVWDWSSTYFTAGPHLKPGRYENIRDIARLPGLMMVKYHSSLKLWGVGQLLKGRR